MPETAVAYHEFHAVPKDEEKDHVYDGPHCWCEPRCLVGTELMRVFVHSTEKVVLMTRSHPAPPEWWKMSTKFNPADLEGY